MSDPIPAILLVSGIIIALLLIEVLVLLLPFRVSLSFQTPESEIKGIIVGSWFIFGLEMLVSGKDPQVSVVVGGVRLVTRPLLLHGPGKRTHREVVPVRDRVPELFHPCWLQGPVFGGVLLTLSGIPGSINLGGLHGSGLATRVQPGWCMACTGP